MASHSLKSVDAASAFADSFEFRTKAAGGGVAAYQSNLGGDGATGFADAGREKSFRQYGAFNGIPYAAIRPIITRVAMQRIRVGVRPRRAN